jgi:uncharacterized protein YpmB
MNRIIVVILISFITVFGSTSCKNKKKLAEEKARQEQLAKNNQVKAELEALLKDDQMSIEEKEKALARLKGSGANSPEINALIKKVEAQINEAKAKKKAAEEKARQEKEAKERAEKEMAPKKLTLSEHFQTITNSGSTNQANNKIEEALKLFSSPETPVLIVISEEGGEKDYDKPTTIKKYLEYLKDQKKNLNEIINIVYDNGGKIKELELRKK